MDMITLRSLKFRLDEGSHDWKEVCTSLHRCFMSGFELGRELMLLTLPDIVLLSEHFVGIK